ncbi:MAG: DUF4832 domain-containing protein [Coprococcus sp.]|uniref:DUF4832 domain-containing protein n=1 Tax=Coprococcus catus TaxID=116085 RepID=UPI001C036AE1|nr:DUF4832 domain-containing protein [Coprococcus catus]MBT9772928.1 DUF4832 domain-containing protein [Coprococcus catus]
MNSLKRWRLWCAVPVVFILLFIISIYTFSKKNVKEYERTEEVFGNPLMGYAPCAWNTTVSDDVSLLYMDITWAELEPEEGQYNWESIDKENQLSRWRKEGKHIVLRFVCDVPGQEKHMDIPEWLYEKIDHEGTWYDVEFGKGFAPDYNNEEMIRYHAKAVEALGEHLGKDGLISYIELGSLGHWGEWHVNYSAGIQRLPNEAVRKQYVVPWTGAFPDAMLLMRRPFSHASEYGMGLYNDMAGHPDETEVWLREIENGGDLSQTDEKNALISMHDFWKTAPVGGELTSSFSMEDLLETNLDQTAALIRESHTTFLGPHVANNQYLQGYHTVLKNMGYRLRISEAVLSNKLKGTKLSMTWANDGTAPFYKDWPVWVYVTDENGDTIEKKQVEMKLSSILPGESVKTEIYLETKKLVDLAGKKYNIRIGVEDPMTGKENLRLAMKCRYMDGRNLLW